MGWIYTYGRTAVVCDDCNEHVGIDRADVPVEDWLANSGRHVAEDRAHTNGWTGTEDFHYCPDCRD